MILYSASLYFTPNLENYLKNSLDYRFPIHPLLFSFDVASLPLNLLEQESYVIKKWRNAWGIYNLGYIFAH